MARDASSLRTGLEVDARFRTDVRGAVQPRGAPLREKGQDVERHGWFSNARHWRNPSLWLDIVCFSDSDFLLNTLCD